MSGGWMIIFKKCGAQNERIPAIKTSVKVNTVRQLCDALRQTVDITMERQLKVVTGTSDFSDVVQVEIYVV